ncbi:MAG: DHH family phosphoesterase [Nanoarchaeota archaeon]
MLTKKQINELKEHFEKCQNPVFYYDNDADGLCSFLLLRRFLGKGKGVAVKNYPDLNLQYARKVHEFNSDYVFILDKPVVSREFLENVQAVNVPVVWIDHHDTKFKNEFHNLHIYNPTRNKGKNNSSEPVTYLIYKITKRKEDLWIAMMGCIADHYMPDFAKDFAKHYPEYWKEGIRKPFDAYYKTEVGRIAQSLGFGLKDTTKNVVLMQNFLISCPSLADVFMESEGNLFFREKCLETRKKYNALIEKAKENISGNLIFFYYSGELGISSEISNELSYYYPKKYICVAYIKGGVSNISLRGNNIRRIFGKIIKKFELASGGGHRNAVGARIRSEDLIKFKNALEKEVN